MSTNQPTMFPLDEKTLKQTKSNLRPIENALSQTITRAMAKRRQAIDSESDDESIAKPVPKPRPRPRIPRVRLPLMVSIGTQTSEDEDYHSAVDPDEIIPDIQYPECVICYDPIKDHKKIVRLGCCDNAYCRDCTLKIDKCAVCTTKLPYNDKSEELRTLQAEHERDMEDLGGVADMEIHLRDLLIDQLKTEIAKNPTASKATLKAAPKTNKVYRSNDVQCCGHSKGKDKRCGITTPGFLRQCDRCDMYVCRHHACACGTNLFSTD